MKSVKNRIKHKLIDLKFQDTIKDKIFNKKVKSRKIKDSLFETLYINKFSKFHKYNHIIKRNLLKRKINQIPKCCYCYDKNGLCPFWYYHNSEGFVKCLYYNDLQCIPHDSETSWKKAQKRFTRKKINEKDTAFILWDQVKECEFEEICD